MNHSHHRTERLNLTNAAQQLGMSVRALGQRIQAGEIKTEHIAGYNFVPLDDVARFAGALRDGARASAEVAEQERKDQENVVVRDEIARDMKYLNERAKTIGMGFLAED